MVRGFLPDGTYRPVAWFHSQHVERLFRAEVLRMLVGKELISEVFPNLSEALHTLPDGSRGTNSHYLTRIDFDLLWWIPNLVLLLYPVPFVVKIIRTGLEP